MNDNILDGPMQEEPGDMDGAAGASNGRCAGGGRQDDPWEYHNLLTLDGGGVRGYWSLLVLNQLMKLVARREEKHREPAYSSFHPSEYQRNASQVKLSREEKDKQSDLNNAEKYRALDPTKRFLPCHYFDYIGGSSTGALIAIMLGRLRMTVPDCLGEYEKLGSEVFGQPRKLCELNFPLVRRTKYDAEQLKDVFQDVTRRRREVPEDKDQIVEPSKFPSREWVCRTFVTTLAAITDNKGSEFNPVAEPYILRSYDYLPRDPSTRANTQGRTSRKSTWRDQEPGAEEKARKAQPVRKINKGKAHNMEIPLVARAATAALCFFEPLKYDLDSERSILFEDGGFGTTNNPTQEGIEEIQGLHGQGKLGAVVSVGTARSDKATGNEKTTIGRIKTRLGRITNVATSPETVHQRVKNMLDVEYYRLNPELPSHLLDIQLDDWLPRRPKSKTRYFMRTGKTKPAGSDTLNEIRSMFDRYAADPDVNEKLEQCAEELFQRRRDRALDTSKWERYAIGSSYKCRLERVHEECSENFTFYLRRQWEKHLAEHHGLELQRIKSEVQRSSTLFRYPEKSS